MAKLTSKAKQTTNPHIDVVDIQGKKTGSFTLSAALFTKEANPYLVAQTVHVYHANQSQGTRSTKTRADVVGSTRKIYRQKGTGRARHGDIKAPIFVGGGIAHGPKPGTTRLKMPKTMRRKTLATILTQYAKEGRVRIIKGLEDIEGKTKKLHSIFTNLNLISKKEPRNKMILLVMSLGLSNLERAARNLPFVTITLTTNLNSYEILRHDYLVFTPSSMNELEKMFINSNDQSKKPHHSTVQLKEELPTPKTSKEVSSIKTKRLAQTKMARKKVVLKSKTKP